MSPEHKLIEPELIRYILNGLFATGVHYSILTLNLQVLEFTYAGVANLIAGAFGISTSFLGNRYFVFKKTDQSFTQQAWKFCILYLVIALVHGAILFVWSDLFGRDYRIGFLIATAIQFLASYVGNKLLVFTHEI